MLKQTMGIQSPKFRLQEMSFLQQINRKGKKSNEGEGEIIDLKETQKTYQPMQRLALTQILIQANIVFLKVTYDIYWTIGNLTLIGYLVVLKNYFIYLANVFII